MSKISRLTVTMSLSSDDWNRVACGLLRAYFSSTEGLSSFLDSDTEPALRLLQLAIPRPIDEPLEPIPEELLRIVNTVPDPDDTVEFPNPLKVGANRTRDLWHAKILRGYDLPAQERDRVLDRAVEQCSSLSVCVAAIVRRMDIIMTSLDPVPELHQRGDGCSLIVVDSGRARRTTMVLRKKNDDQRCYKEIFGVEFDFVEDPAPVVSLAPVWDFLHIEESKLGGWHGRAIDGVSVSVRPEFA